MGSDRFVAATGVNPSLDINTPSSRPRRHDGSSNPSPSKSAASKAVVSSRTGVGTLDGLQSRVLQTSAHHLSPLRRCELALYRCSPSRVSYDTHSNHPTGQWLISRWYLEQWRRAQSLGGRGKAGVNIGVHQLAHRRDRDDPRFARSRAVLSEGPRRPGSTTPIDFSQSTTSSLEGGRSPSTAAAFSKCGLTSRVVD